MPFSITFVSGIATSRTRGIAFLESSEDTEVNGHDAFDKLRPKKQGDVRNRFEYWLGKHTHDKYFHGWPNDATRKDLFVFKWSDSANHRLYGFLCHPRAADSAFHLHLGIA